MQPRRVIAVICSHLGRALIGAVAGFCLFGMLAIVAMDRFNVFEDTDRGRGHFKGFIALGTMFFALLASLHGRTRIAGVTEAVIKGMLAGSFAGIALGGLLGHAMETKAAAVLGLFLGVPIGAIAGGVIAFEAYHLNG